MLEVKVLPILGHTNRAIAFSCSATGMLAIGGENGDINIWDLDKRSILWHADLNEKLTDIVFIKNGGQLAVATRNGFSVINLRGDMKMAQFDHSGVIHKIISSEDGRILACLCSREILLFETSRNINFQEIKYNSDPHDVSVSIHPGNLFVATADDKFGGKVDLFSVRSGNHVLALTEVELGATDIEFLDAKHLMWTVRNYDGLRTVVWDIDANKRHRLDCILSFIADTGNQCANRKLNKVLKHLIRKTRKESASFAWEQADKEIRVFLESLLQERGVNFDQPHAYEYDSREDCLLMICC